jgi:pimeloyl-ACP methyl ester carboxylesterase
LAVPGGVIEYLSVGAGMPSTVFAHGLAGGIEDTRPLGGGIAGTRTFAHFDGHGASRVDGARGGYHGLADQLAAVATHVSARQALGVSLGAATVLRLLATERRAGARPRFERVVLFLPAALDRAAPSALTRHQLLAARIEARDAEGVAAALLATQPRGARSLPVARDWAATRARQLIATASPARWSALAAAAPLSGPAELADIDIPVLVIAQRGDEVHPVEVAERIVEALPNAALRVFDEAGALWGHRAESRALLRGFLGARNSSAASID